MTGFLLSFVRTILNFIRSVSTNKLLSTEYLCLPEYAYQSTYICTMSHRPFETSVLLIFAMQVTLLKELLDIGLCMAQGQEAKTGQETRMTERPRATANGKEVIPPPWPDCRLVGIR